MGAENYFGSGNVIVTVSDNQGGTDTEIFEVNIESVNDIPVVSNLESEVIEDGIVSIFPNGLDIEGSELIFSVNDEPSSGSVDLLNWFFTYTLSWSDKLAEIILENASESQDNAGSLLELSNGITYTFRAGGTAKIKEIPAKSVRKYLDIKCIRAQIIENRTILNVIFHFIFLTTYHEVQLFD